MRSERVERTFSLRLVGGCHGAGAVAGAFARHGLRVSAASFVVCAFVQAVAGGRALPRRVPLTRPLRLFADLSIAIRTMRAAEPVS